MASESTACSPWRSIFSFHYRPHKGSTDNWQQKSKGCQSKLTCSVFFFQDELALLQGAPTGTHNSSCYEQVCPKGLTFSFESKLQSNTCQLTTNQQCIQKVVLDSGNQFLIWIEDLRTEGVVRWTDCKASWGKFVIYDIWLFRYKENGLDFSAEDINKIFRKNLSIHTNLL